MEKTLDGSIPKKTAIAWLKDKAVLIVMSGKQFGASLVPVRGDNSIGRQPDGNSLAISDAKMSKQHFVITYSAEGYFLRDCESRNGTWLNGKNVSKPQKLAYGDRIIAGTSIFRFFIEESLDKN
ncbi:MAG: FHA domain-containing protein [Spirochaetes bacterium]|nr:FHA domain-containing protein [Spirochaetota bacterium]MBU0955956.1 FHA domain-containing protein [Spirochaetota bacterium]